MAQKKKQQVKQPVKQANIEYSGKITIAIQDGNKIISKKEYHNNGSNSLFNFLCLCIKGDYATANEKRPFYIKAFKAADTETPDSIKTYLTGKGYERLGQFDTNRITSGSTAVGYNKVATVEDNKVTLHFRLPYSLITSQELNMFCLYGKDYGGDNNTKNWSAYYLLTNDDETAFTNLTINSSQNYNLLLEWTMTIDNTTKTSTTGETN